MLKKTALLIIITIFPIVVNGQETAHVERSVSSAQIGFLGGYYTLERQVGLYSVLRLEAGLDAAIFGGTFYPYTGFIAVPTLILQPRHYYNREKRLKKGKRLDHNSGNFVAFSIRYHPNWFYISNYYVDPVSDISLVPMWGMKRGLGKRFMFETGVGIGYRYFIVDEQGFNEDYGDVVIEVLLRFGLRFN